MKIATQYTLYISVHDNERPTKSFQSEGPDSSSESITLYDGITRLMSLALQYGASFENVGDLLAGGTFEPCGSGHLRFMNARHTMELLLGTGEVWAGSVFEIRQSTNVKDLEII